MGRRRGGVRRGRKEGGVRRRQLQQRSFLLLLLLRRGQQAEFLRNGWEGRLHCGGGACGRGLGWLFPGRSGGRLLLAGTLALARPGRLPGDDPPPAHAADGAADEARPAAAVRGVGGVLSEELKDSPQRKSRSLTKTDG